MSEAPVAAPGLDSARALSAAAAGFDRAAAGYETACHNELFAAMRLRVHRLLAEVLPPEGRVLEIGCGVGLDTEFLVRRGHVVVAADPAPGMLEHARRRLADRPTLAGRATWRLAGVDDLAADHGTGPEAILDAIVSNFGALNCVGDLASLRHLTRTRLRSGGVVILGLMSRICVWEIAYFLCRLRPRTALRRLARSPVPVEVEQVSVPTWYHSVRSVTAALGDGLVLRRVVGLNVLLPPPFLAGPWQRVPAALRSWLTRCDARVSTWPLFDRLGDHVVIELVKR